MRKEEVKNRFERLKQLISSRQEQELAHQKGTTDINFCDVHDVNLLGYAVILGELDEVKSLVEQNARSHNALGSALIEGQLSIAKYLYTQGFPCNQLPLADVKNPECRSWFIHQIQQSITTEKENKAVFFAHKSSQQVYASQDPFNTKMKTLSKLIRGAEIGDVEVMANYKRESRKLEKYKKQLPSMLLAACANNQTKMAELLLQDGASPNNQKPFFDSPLYAAASNGCTEVLLFLLSQGADINYQNSFKKTALLAALDKKHLQIVNVLLGAGADVTLSNHRNQNPLHCVVLSDWNDGLELLVEHPKFHSLLSQKDIYGMKPLDYAIQKGNAFAIGRLKGSSNFTNRVSNLPPINQTNVMKKMSYYLRLNYRSLEFFSVDGHCNGFSFLWDMYSYQGRENYYFDTLRLMASWDGTQEQLDAPFATNIAQSYYFKNLSELFEQWINDVIWFQQGTLKELALQIHQTDRVEQARMIGAKLSPKLLSYTIDNCMTSSRLAEYFTMYLNNMPSGTRVQIGGASHATAAYLKPNGMIAYYDPNFLSEAGDIDGVTQWEQCFVDTKIIALAQAKFNEQSVLNFECDLLFFYYDDPDLAHRLEQHEAIAQSKLPQSLEECELFKKKSPNQFTPLHTAVLCGSVVNIHQLLSPKNRLVDINSKDINGRTALDIAVKSGNITLIDVLLSYYRDNDQIDTRSLLSADLNNPQLVNLLLTNKERMDLGLVLFDAIYTKNTALIQRLIASRAIDINEVEHNFMSPICAAFKTFNLEIIKVLLNNGASLTKVKNLNKPYFENSPLKQLAESPQDILSAILTALNDVNQTDDYGNSLIHYLPGTDLFRMHYLVDYIIKNGGDLEKKAASGSTVFEQLMANSMHADNACNIILSHLNLEKASETTLELLNNHLIEKIKNKEYELLSHRLTYCRGILLNRCNKSGGTALLYAVLQGDLKSTELLLEAGADIQVVSRPNRQTALHLAVKHNFPDLVTFLLNKGADPNQMNAAEKTPKDFVNEQTSEVIKQALSHAVHFKN